MRTVLEPVTPTETAVLNRASGTLARYRFLGIDVNLLTLPDLNDLVERTIADQDKIVLANHNLHSVYIFHHDERMRRYYAQAKYTHIDGMPLVWLAKCLGIPATPVHRVTYVDWIYPLFSNSARHGWRIFYLGSRPGIAHKGAAQLRARFPKLDIATADGYFDASPKSRDSGAIITKINDYRPHVLFVGMGMPRQEQWILENAAALSANVILPSGAAMDYVVGAIPTPPRWAGRLGLEWLARLTNEPPRLWRRYLVEPWYVMGLFLSELAGRNQLKRF